MQLKKLLPILICSFFVNFLAEAQNSYQEDVVYITRSIDTFIEHNDGVQDKRESEIILVLLEADSSGGIYKIHLLADENNMYKTYSILKQMTPRVFREKKFRQWKDKVIVIPVYSLGELAADPKGGPVYTYVEKMVSDSLRLHEDEKFVSIPALFYTIPRYQYRARIN